MTTVDEPVAFRRHQPPTLADIVEQERAAVATGQAEPCGTTCDDGCHGPLTCVRAAHPHNPDADMGLAPDGRPLPRGDVVPHAGYTPDGTLVQWTCLPGDHDGLTTEQRTAKRAADEQAARAAATEQLLAAVDPALLIQFLREGGHL